jgi:hypothetical protein
MKLMQTLYLICFIGIVFYIVNSSHLLDHTLESFENPVQSIANSLPKVSMPLQEKRISAEKIPEIAMPGGLPYGPYLQTASVGSYQFQDPSIMPAELSQMKSLSEDLRSFLRFEAPSIQKSSDPTVSLPLTQLRADASKLNQEISVLQKNPGIASTLTQESLADIQGSLSFLQRKVRVFQTAGVVSGGVEGFANIPKTRATPDDLQSLQKKIYAAILILSASGTQDPIVQARIQNLQKMYNQTTEMITKLDKGFWKPADIPVFQEDITTILPSLDKPDKPLMDLSAQGDGTTLSAIEMQLADLVGAGNAKSVFKNIQDKGSFNVNIDFGYNTSDDSSINLSKGVTYGSAKEQDVDGPFDSTMSGMDDRAEETQKSITPGHLDWKQRATGICDQIKQRGLDPLDFGCISEGSIMSPAYSWRGHTKMVCGRLASTTDPNLPRVCGCPPSDWNGWSLPTCLGPPNAKVPGKMPPECAKGIYDT